MDISADVPIAPPSLFQIRAYLVLPCNRSMLAPVYQMVLEEQWIMLKVS